MTDQQHRKVFDSEAARATFLVVFVCRDGTESHKFGADSRERGACVPYERVDVVEEDLGRLR